MKNRKWNFIVHTKPTGRTITTGSTDNQTDELMLPAGFSVNEDQSITTQDERIKKVQEKMKQAHMEHLKKKYGTDQPFRDQGCCDEPALYPVGINPD